jgi:signal transduction histidine kinase
VRALHRALDRGDDAPLLVLRLPELTEIAWERGKAAARRVEQSAARAFQAAARGIVRQDDLRVHERGTDRFLIALLAPSRDRKHPPVTADLRATLERVAEGIALSTGRRMQTGWWNVQERDEIVDLERTILRALERGERERARAELLATVGHELRTPLTSIRGYIETLLDEPLDPPTTRRFLEPARREALRLGRLVEGMLEFSLLDLSPRERGATCELLAQLRAALESLAPLASARSIRLELADGGPQRARIDPDACMHVLINVIENAIKYGRAGGRVTVRCERQEPFVAAIVDDDGPGVAPHDRKRVFVFGARGPGDEAGGSGIGLALVKAIVERAGGEVSLAASPLGGARFIIRIPAAS